MADFAGDIQKFQRYGTYVYKFDNVGNLIFNSSSLDFSNVYLSLPIKNVVYDNNKVQSFYDPTFTEFVPPTPVDTTTEVLSDIQQKVDVLETENTNLKVKLDELTAQSQENMSQPDKLAIKQVILELRKALGQGRVESDFSEDFPYTAIRKEKI